MIDVVLFAVAIIVCAVIVACSIADARDDRKREMSEYNEMDHRRQLRQAEFDAHARQAASAELFYVYTHMHFPGDGRHE